MRFPVSLLLASVALSAGPWRVALEPAGYDLGQVRILEGLEGGRDTGERVLVRSVVDTHDERLEIVWEKAMEVPVYVLPEQARVFCRERRSGAPLVAGWHESGKPVLWAAVSPGRDGRERFPLLPHTLRSLGVRPSLEARDLWAFFDSSYRLRADPEYLAVRWRQGGIAAIHVAGWQYWEPNPERDRWLQRLIETCHRQAVQVYAWVEFPHVSGKFWEEHPGWREKTASGQDAHLDWRQLMDLTHPECEREVTAGLRALVDRFDWDGVNLGELYFESLEGAANPARFTPFAPHAKEELRKRSGVDPVAGLTDPKQLRKLLDARADLAADLQRKWLGELQWIRRATPHLDLVLTHIDDRFDSTMRDKLGADAARLLPFAERAGAAFLIEDPATVWHLGPERYAEIARRYSPLTKRPDRLAIDLNIVERYQDVYPTKQQAGVELFQLVRTAANNFPRVALYFENSILKQDWSLLAAAAATARVVSREDSVVTVDAPRGGLIRWEGCAAIDGRVWPASDGQLVLLPVGQSKLEPCETRLSMGLADFNGMLKDVRSLDGDKLEIRYSSAARAIAVLMKDGVRRAVMLPAGDRKEVVGWRD